MFDEGGRHLPASAVTQHPGVGRKHPLDGADGPTGAGNGELQAAWDRALGNRRVEDELLHIDQVVAKRVDVDAGPVGCRILFENLNDLGDRSEGALPLRFRDRPGCGDVTGMERAVSRVLFDSGLRPTYSKRRIIRRELERYGS